MSVSDYICKCLRLISCLCAFWLFVIYAQAAVADDAQKLQESQQVRQQTQQQGEAIASDEDDNDQSAVQPGQKQHAILGLANPAAVNCIKKGGVLKEETKPNGAKFSVCYFEDNLQCEAWALLRQECRAGGVKVTGYYTDAARYCAIKGGRFIPSLPNADGGSNSVTSNKETGSCQLPNGDTCAAQAFWEGACP